MSFCFKLLILFTITYLCSCSNTRRLTYFNGIGDSTVTTQQIIPASKIYPNDILSVTVSSLNPEATVIFNEAPLKETNSQSVTSGGYLVNTEGAIKFPVLGDIEVVGKTTEEVSKIITESLLAKQLLVDPIVTVRFKNFRVTVLGEVRNPEVLAVPSEKISLLEALGLCGDITLYGKRENVLLIREEQGVRQTTRLNLNSAEFLASPYYYLQANDIVYVEPNRARVATSGTAQIWVPLTVATVSLGTLIWNIFK